MADREIDLGINPEGFQSTAQQLNSLYGTAESGLADLLTSTDDFAAKWRDLWERQPSTAPIDRMLSGAGHAVDGLSSDLSDATKEIDNLSSGLVRLHSDLNRLKEAGIDTSNIKEQANQLEALMAQMKRMTSEEAGIRGAGVYGAGPMQIPPEKASEDIGATLEKMAASFDQMRAQMTERTEIAEDQGDQPIPGLQTLNEANRGLTEMVAGLAKVNKELVAQGRLMERQRQEGTRPGGAAPQLPGLPGPPGPPKPEEPSDPKGGGRIRTEMMRFMRGMLGRGGGAAGIGGRAISGMAGAGGMAGAAALGVGIPLAAIAAMGLVYRGLRGKAEQSEVAQIGTEQIARRLGVQRPESFRALSGMFFPGADESQRQRFNQIRDQFGISRQEFIQAMGSMESPRMVGAGGDAETAGARVEGLFRGAGRFARREGRELNEVMQMISTLGQAGLQPDDLESVLNRVMPDAMAAGMEEGIARSDTMRGIMSFTQRTVEVIGEADANSVMNASAMIEAFAGTGGGGMFRGGAGQRLVGAIEQGAQDPTKFALFYRTLQRSAGLEGSQEGGFREFLEKQAQTVFGGNEAMMEEFRRSQTTQQVGYLQETLRANPALLGKFMQGVEQETGGRRDLMDMILRTLGLSGMEALQTRAFMAQGGAERLVREGETVRIAQELKRGERTIDTGEQDLIDRMKAGGELAELTPKEKARIEQLMKAQQINRGEVIPFKEFNDHIASIKDTTAKTLDADLDASDSASRLTQGMANNIAGMRGEMNAWASRMVSALTGEKREKSDDELFRKAAMQGGRSKKAIADAAKAELSKRGFQTRPGETGPFKQVAASYDKSLEEQISNAESTLKLGNSNEHQNSGG